MTKENKQYMVLDAIGNPIARPNGTEANPFIFYSLIEACKFAEEEKKNQDAVAVVRIEVLERQGSGM